MKCPTWDCQKQATHALVYGCINQHIKDTQACPQHMLEYVNALPHCYCGECQQPYTDHITQKL